MTDEHAQQFVFDPASLQTWEDQMDRQFLVFFHAYQAEQQKKRGRFQNEMGELRAEMVKTFLSTFPPEVSQHIERRITRLKSFEGDKKFKAEAISMLMEMYMFGIFQGFKQHEQVDELWKNHFDTKK